jgi:hypothetical protein
MSKQFQHDEFFCIATRCWHAALADVRGGKLWGAFLDFTDRFPDHTSDDNTHVYLAFHGDGDRSPPMWDLSWCCSHFEHTSRDDVAKLVEFFDTLTALLEKPQFPAMGVERLQEPHLHLKLYDPAEAVREEIMQRGEEMEEWQPTEGRAAAE